MITALDGYLDSYFQEVYLDADDLSMFAKVTEQVSDDALGNYIDQLEGEVRKYLTKNLNYGKAAKRMYNVFRLSGRYDEGSSIPIDAVRAQADTLILEVVAALEGDGESEIVASLLSLTKALQSQPPGTARTAEVEGAKDRMINVINTFFRDKLTSVPSIDEYIAGIQSG